MENNLTENMPKIRIAWKNFATKESGHGKWHSESERKNLMIWIGEMNTKYPELTHWLENDVQTVGRMNV